MSLPIIGAAVSKAVASIGAFSSTLGQALNAAYKDKWEGSKAEASSLRCGTVWCTEMGNDYALDDLNLESITEVCDKLTSRGNSPSTVNRKLAALKVMVGAAIRRDWLASAPHYPKYKEYEGRLRYYSDEEVESLLSWVSGSPYLRDLFLLAVETGIRYGNLVGLIKRDIDMKLGVIKLEVNKVNKRRSVLITKRARPVLKRLMDAAARDSDKLFPPEEKTLKTRHISNVITAWKADRQLPPDDEACFHTFRHTTCSRLVQAGVPILVVKEWMCHETLETTMRYAHLAPSNLDLARDALDKREADAE